MLEDWHPSSQNTYILASYKRSWQPMHNFRPLPFNCIGINFIAGNRKRHGNKKNTTNKHTDGLTETHLQIFYSLK